MLLQPNNRVIEAYVPEYYSGAVEDNVDPLKIGRVRVRILEMYSTPNEIPTIHLPWIYPNYTDNTHFEVPRLGATVRVAFPLGVSYFAYYNAGSHGIDEVPEQFLKNYPNVYGTVDENGNSIRVDKSTNTVYIENATGKGMNIDTKGAKNEDFYKVVCNVDTSVKYKVPSFMVDGNFGTTSGASTTFSTTDGRMITVVNGIVVNVA